MPEIDIVLVAPLYEGNVGFAARVMKNFGFTRMVLVDPCKMGEEAKGRASHAQDVLKNAEMCTIEDVFSRSSIVVATTGQVSKSVCTPMRMPFFSPRELRERIGTADGRVSILFGRENWGLNNEEVKRSDMICTIPTAPDYPIMNLSHAVGVVCYELADLPSAKYKLASPYELGHLYQHIDRFLDSVHHPAFKRENTMIMIRRILGRAGLTTREASTIHGLLRRTEWHVDPDALDREKEMQRKHKNQHHELGQSPDFDKENE
ncbi:RNA methyltransferase [Methanoregula sp.]|jgi:TrmH family RNA methyltransferase|uniref:RNA methyltransferase n=1 Tax=Methanoregula sp. TaxID=2052170 RepID=UPI003C2684CD